MMGGVGGAGEVVKDLAMFIADGAVLQMGGNLVDFLEKAEGVIGGRRGEVRHLLVDTKGGFGLGGDGADAFGRGWFVMEGRECFGRGVEELFPWRLPAVGEPTNGLTDATEVGGGAVGVFVHHEGRRLRPLVAQSLGFVVDEPVEGVVLAVAGVSGEVADDVGGGGPEGDRRVRAEGVAF